MKKALLTLAAVFGMGFAANADVVSVITEDLKYGNAVEVSKIEMNSDITISLSKGSNSNAPKYYTSGSAIRFYGGNTMTFTAASGFEITDITITQNAGGNGWNAGSSVKVDGKTGTFTGTTGSQKTTAESIWNGKASSVEVTNGGTKGNVRLGTIKVTYASTVAAAVETPVITLVEGDYGFNAEITCATEGAEIFYTTDGTEPTAESTKYNAPFEVWEKCTIQAIAIKGEDKSRVATLEANPPMMLDGFSALLGIEDTTIEQPVIVKGNMTAVYKNGGNLYVECGGSYMLFFSNSNDFKNMEFTNGDTFKRAEGTFKFYDDQPEIVDPTFGEITTGGEAVAAKPYPVEYINEGMMCQYLIINPVSMTVSGRNITFTDINGNELAGYNKFNLTLPTETTGKYYTVTGFVGKNKGSLQFLPTEFEEVTVETVETPVIEPAPEGSFDIEVNKIEITCATEDAEIFYTLDGSDPDMDSEYYNGPISIGTEAQFTVKAIAYKEGWLPSAIATAEYKNVTGIEDVVMGSNEAVEYFNLQGVRVAEPAAGLYIRRQGNKVEKVTVK